MPLRGGTAICNQSEFAVAGRLLPLQGAAKSHHGFDSCLLLLGPALRIPHTELRALSYCCLGRTEGEDFKSCRKEWILNPHPWNRCSLVHQRMLSPHCSGGRNPLCKQHSYLGLHTTLQNTPCFPSCAEKLGRKQRSHCQQPVISTVHLRSDLHLSK